MGRMTKYPSFPVRDDGTVYRGGTVFELDAEHRSSLTKLLHGFSYSTTSLVDDRRKKTPRNTAKNDAFVNKWKGVIDYDDSQKIAQLCMLLSLETATFHKVDADKRSGMSRTTFSNAERLVFIHHIPAYMFGVKGPDVYVKYHFTRARGGALIFHLESLHQ